MFVLLACVETSFGEGLQNKVKVLTKREGENTRFLLQNSETCDMTATLEIGAVGLKSSVPLPLTITVAAGQTIDALTLTPTNRNHDWSYNYTNHYTVGRADVSQGSTSISSQ